MLTRRFLQLLIGLAMYGVSLAMFIRASLGTAPWDVLHQGLATRTGLSDGGLPPPAKAHPTSPRQSTPAASVGADRDMTDRPPV